MKIKKPFFTRYFANGEDVVACGQELAMTLTVPLASENIAMMEMRSGYSVQLYGSSGLMNSVFTISFYPSKLKYVR